MHADLRSLFLKQAKYIGGRWLLPVSALIAAGMALTGNYTLVLKDGTLYVCDDASEEDSCPKPAPNQATVKGGKTPE